MAGVRDKESEKKERARERAIARERKEEVCCYMMHGVKINRSGKGEEESGIEEEKKKEMGKGETENEQLEGEVNRGNLWFLEGGTKQEAVSQSDREWQHDITAPTHTHTPEPDPYE